MSLLEEIKNWDDTVVLHEQDFHEEINLDARQLSALAYCWDVEEIWPENSETEQVEEFELISINLTILDLAHMN